MSARSFPGLALALAATLVAASTARAEFRWHENLDQARQEAAQTNRLLLVHFGAPWCGPCQQLVRDVFSQPDFGAPLEPYYVAVKVNVDEHQALTKQLGVRSIPADVILAPDGHVVQQFNSPRTAREYTGQLVSIAQSQRGPQSPATMVAAAPQHAAPPQSAPQQTQPAYQQQAAPPPADDRYADYYRDRYSLQQPQPQQYAAPQPQVAAYNPPVAGAAPRYEPQSQPQPPIAQPPASQSTAPAQQSSAAAQAPVNPALAKVPPGCPPVAMDGFCPVTLVSAGSWLPGDAQWGAIHRGRTYLFTSAANQQKFLADPDRFSPIISGNDPVIALQRGEQVPGKREHGVFFNDRIFLFANEASLNQFSSAPQRYVSDLQAMRHTDSIRR